MASVQDVVDAVDQDKQGVEAAAARLTADLQALSQQITDLQAQIASGAGVTSADLDALKAGVDAVTRGCGHRPYGATRSARLTICRLTVDNRSPSTR